jgi:homeobox-leucine zipper protein
MSSLHLFSILLILVPLLVQCERLLTFVAPFMGKSSTLLSPGLGAGTSLSEEKFSSQAMGVPYFDLEHVERPSVNLVYPYHLSRTPEMEKSLMVEAAARAMEELLELLRVNEPMWIKSPTDGRYFLEGDVYNKRFAKINHFKSSGAWIESSKDSSIVPMTAVHLIEIFADSVYPNNFLLLAKINI